MTTTILIICSAFFIYIIVNQYFKILKYEELISLSQDHFENSKNLLNKLLEIYITAKHRIDRIDKDGAFSSDDEVGFAFKLISTTIIELTSKLQELKDITDGKDTTEE